MADTQAGGENGQTLDHGTDEASENVTKADSDATGAYQAPGGGTTEDREQEEEEELPFPGFVPVVFRCMDQRNSVRFWCLRTITWPYPFTCTFIQVCIISVY